MPSDLDEYRNLVSSNPKLMEGVTYSYYKDHKNEFNVPIPAQGTSPKPNVYKSIAQSTLKNVELGLPEDEQAIARLTPSGGVNNMTSRERQFVQKQIAKKIVEMSMARNIQAKNPSATPEQVQQQVQQQNTEIDQRAEQWARKQTLRGSRNFKTPELTEHSDDNYWETLTPEYKQFANMRYNQEGTMNPYYYGVELIDSKKILLHSGSPATRDEKLAAGAFYFNPYVTDEQRKDFENDPDKYTKIVSELTDNDRDKLVLQLQTGRLTQDDLVAKYALKRNQNIVSLADKDMILLSQRAKQYHEQYPEVGEYAQITSNIQQGHEILNIYGKQIEGLKRNKEVTEYNNILESVRQQGDILQSKSDEINRLKNTQQVIQLEEKSQVLSGLNEQIRILNDKIKNNTATNVDKSRFVKLTNEYNTVLDAYNKLKENKGVLQYRQAVEEYDNLYSQYENTSTQINNLSKTKNVQQYLGLIDGYEKIKGQTESLLETGRSLEQSPVIQGYKNIIDQQNQVIQDYNTAIDENKQMVLRNPEYTKKMIDKQFKQTMWEWLDPVSKAGLSIGEGVIGMQKNVAKTMVGLIDVSIDMLNTFSDNPKLSNFQKLMDYNVEQMDAVKLLRPENAGGEAYNTIEQVSNVIATMYMMYGLGAAGVNKMMGLNKYSNVGQFLTTYASIYHDESQKIRGTGADPSMTFVLASSSAALQALIENINPNTKMVRAWDDIATKGIVRALRDGKYGAMKKWTNYTLQIAGENLEELGQDIVSTASENIARWSTDKEQVYKDFFDRDNIYETIKITTLATSLMGLPGLIGSNKLSKKEGYLRLAENPETFERVAVEMLQAGQITQRQYNDYTLNVREYARAIKALPKNDIEDWQRQELADLQVERNKITDEITEINNVIGDSHTIETKGIIDNLNSRVKSIDEKISKVMEGESVFSREKPKNEYQLAQEKYTKIESMTGDEKVIAQDKFNTEFGDKIYKRLEYINNNFETIIKELKIKKQC